MSGATDRPTEKRTIAMHGRVNMSEIEKLKKRD